MPLYTLPQPGDGGGNLQTGGVELAVNTSTTSTTFVDLLTVSVTTTAGSKLALEAIASALITVSALQVFFQLTVDGVKVGPACAITGSGANVRQTVSLIALVAGLAAGAHTVKLQWRVASANTATIDVVTNPDRAGARLQFTEVTV